MRRLASFAAALLGAGLISSAPASAFDDSLPRYAPYRGHTIHHHVYVPRYRHVYHIYPRRVEYVRFVHRKPWACRYHHHACAYRLGGFFARKPDFRRLPWYR